MRTLARTLASLEGQYCPGSWEIVVVDNGSNDGTKEMVLAKTAAQSNLRYVHEPVPGLLSGRHRGIRETQGEVVIFIDDDIEASGEWLDSIAAAFRDENAEMVGGPSRPVYEAEPPSWLESLWLEDEAGRRCEWLSLQDLGARRLIDPNLVWGLNFAIRRDLLTRLGGFHPDNIPTHLQRFQGDGETGLTREASARGVSAIYEPSAAVRHLIPRSRLTLNGLQARAFYQGVCDSYASVRAAGGVSRIHSIRSWVRNHLPEAGAGRRAPVQLRHLGRSHRAGFQFHQAEVRRDPGLLEWVCRPDYWDYELPGRAR